MIIITQDHQLQLFYTLIKQMDMMGSFISDLRSQNQGLTTNDLVLQRFSDRDKCPTETFTESQNRKPVTSRGLEEDRGVRGKTTGSGKIGNGKKKNLRQQKDPRKQICFGLSGRDKNGNLVTLHNTKREAGRQHVKENDKKDTHTAGACNQHAGWLFFSTMDRDKFQLHSGSRLREGENK